MVFDTKKVLTEVKEILEAEGIFDKVSLEKLTPTSEETNSLAAYIGIKALSYDQVRPKNTSCGYDRTIFITIDINQLCDTPLDVLDTLDKVERALLEDSKIWKSVVNREFVGVEFDEQQFYPYRTFTILLQVLYRLED